MAQALSSPARALCRNFSVSVRPSAFARTFLGARMAGTYLLAACLLGATNVRARVGSPPVSFSRSVQGEASVDEIVLPFVDEAQYLREDEERLAAGIDGPWRFAAPHQVEIDPASAGTWEALPEGGRIWRLRITSVGARSLNFGFTRYRLPDGATLHLYPAARSTSQDDRIYDGPYDAADNRNELEFWSPVIPGDQAVVELYLPAEASFEPELRLTQISHDYRGFDAILEDAEREGGARQGACNNDVICPEGDSWRDEIRSEGVYTLNGSWTCSGQLLNSHGVTKPPYFLTAYHCGITAANDQTVRVYWNFESPICGLLCCGSLTDNQQGSTLVARYSSSDFCLVELTQEPSAEFAVYYSGWDATDSNAPTSSVAIHHPSVDEKAISFNDDALTVTTYLSNSVPGDGTHWRVNDWEDGTTEPGSSGSGIWDSGHHLVGQLHGGFASCTSITSDWYGRLSRSWTGGGNSSNRLQEWLDPDGTGVRVLDGWDPNNPVAIDERVLEPSGRLRSVTPNPAGSDFQLNFELARPGEVRIELLDAAGRLVGALPQGRMEAGTWSVSWPSETVGRAVRQPGLYFVRLSLDGRCLGANKLVVLR